MRTSIVLDPGHGGTVGIGRSTPFGVRGPNRLLEKNVTLALARGVGRRLGGGARLTRMGDVNLPLSERARISREHGSAAFLSIHGNGNARGGGGSEAWVHSGAGAESFALADEVKSELARLGIRDGGVRRGDLAVLSPSLHAAGCAACLIEVEHLDTPDGARRLGDPRELEAIADGLARAVDRAASRGRAAPRAYSFGRVAPARALEELDLTDFPTNVFVVIPDADSPTVPRQIRESDLERLKRAWDCMMKGRGLTLEGSDDDKRACRELIRGGLADSPLIRGLFEEIACDDAHPLTLHSGRSQPGIFVDAFQFDPTLGSVAAGLNHPGHHTLDLDDFDKLPRVSGNPRNFMMLRHENLVHAFREARQGVLGDTYPVAHNHAIDDENLFRHEQGQIGDMDHLQPTQVGADLLWEFTQNGSVVVSETWHLSGTNITSIDYSP